MTIFQLFRDKPPLDIVVSMLQCVGIENLHDIKHSFTKEDISNCIDHSCWKENMILLKDYYLPCKYKNYCENISPKKLITVIKQCLRPYSYKLESKEKYIKGKKHIVYFLENYNPPPKKKENTCLISFD
tara:strand:- start:3 stop:389 length:387 start_codon:yes stop_codon:yes gene_type:complete